MICKQAFRKVIALFLISIFSLSMACCRNPSPNGNEKECKPSDCERKVEPFLVKRFRSPETIDLTDKSLSEWDDYYLVMEVFVKHNLATDKSGRKSEWADIRGHQPKALEEGDIHLKVYMAYSGSYWYMAVDALDDEIKSVPPSSERPFSGDCVEIFFAGRELDSIQPISSHVARSKDVTRKAFFQLMIPAQPLDSDAYYFSKERTDRGFKESATSSDNIFSIWSEGPRWKAEVKMSLDSFDGYVRPLINGGSPLKMGIDYLDYDLRLAKFTPEDDWGFRPDNVYCLDEKECQVNIPKCMRPVIFELEKETKQ